MTPSGQQAPSHLEADDDATQPPAPAPPPCHPGVVSPLAALGVVVTLAEALVDCLLSGESLVFTLGPECMYSLPFPGVFMLNWSVHMPGQLPSIHSCTSA